MNVRRFLVPALAVGIAAALQAPAVAHPRTDPASGQRIFLRDATIDPTGSVVTLPVFEGVTANGAAVSYIVTESSGRGDAGRRGVNFAPKLANAADTDAVVQVAVDDQGRLVFPATVDFGPDRVVVPGPTGFPPDQAEPGAIAEDGYSPLVQLPDGTVLNAPHVANGTGQADKVWVITDDTVTFELTPGFYEDEQVLYISTDASDPVAAALENVTYAPALAAAPREADVADEEEAASEELAAFVNGQTGADNPERQGLNSALLDGLAPLNVLHEVPESGRFPDYSPLWDVHLAEWSAEAVTNGENTRQTDFDTIVDLAADGVISGPGGVPFASSGFLVNCPVISEAR